MFKRLNRANSGQIDLREQDVLEGRRLRALALGREGNANLGEEALQDIGLTATNLVEEEEE